MKKLTYKCIKWLEEYFKDNGNPKAVIGISGGKDSTVVAYLCVKALGKENVIGVLMPNGKQSDITDSYEVLNNLGIEHCEINIQDAFESVRLSIPYNFTEQARVNLAPRIRMTTLYAIAQSVGGRVVGTGNLSESILGYYTLWGDGAHDLNPIGNMLVSEVISLGKDLGVPDRLLYKTPSDGLTGKSDEDSLGFTYADVEKVILHDDEDLDKDIKAKIEDRINKSIWKWHIRPNIPSFDEYDLMKWHHKK